MADRFRFRMRGDVMFRELDGAWVPMTATTPISDTDREAAAEETRRHIKAWCDGKVRENIGETVV